jgi:hypothetical protein
LPSDILGGDDQMEWTIAIAAISFVTTALTIAELLENR